MAARYVFWRTDKGTAYRGADDRFAPRRLLADIATSAAIDADGQITWRGWSFLTLNPVIIGSIAVLDTNREELNRADTASIFQRAVAKIIRARGTSSQLEPTTFIRAANAAAAAYYRKPRTDYVLVTTLSVQSLPSIRIAVGNSRIESIRDRSRYPLPAVLRGERRFNDPNANHQYVRVRTSGRTCHEAVERGLETLLLTCGLWNLIATRGSWSIRFNGRQRRPVGVIHVGPIHTLHATDGKPVNEFYWYALDYAEQLVPFNPRNGWETIEKNRRWAMRTMRGLPYAPDLRRLLVRYAEALSKADSDVAFLQLWSILEKITNTVGGKYDETIRRATWIWPDGDVASEVLQYLRHYRNQYVHAAASSADRDHVAQLMKSFVDPHLLALLRNDFHVQTLEEYAACLSLPTRLDELRRRRRHMERALRIRQSWTKNK